MMMIAIAQVSMVMASSKGTDGSADSERVGLSQLQSLKYVLVGWETCHNIRASFARPPVDCGGASPEVHSPRNRDTAPISAQLRDALSPLSPNVCAHDGTTMTAQAVESDFTEDRECSGARGCLPLPAFHQRDAEDRLMR